MKRLDQVGGLCFKPGPNVRDCGNESKKPGVSVEGRAAGALTFNSQEKTLYHGLFRGTF